MEAGENPTTWGKERDRDLELFDLFFDDIPMGCHMGKATLFSKSRDPDKTTLMTRNKLRGGTWWNPAFETSHSGEFGLIRTNIL